MSRGPALTQCYGAYGRRRNFISHFPFFTLRGDIPKKKRLMRFTTCFVSMRIGRKHEDVLPAARIAVLLLASPIRMTNR